MARVTLKRMLALLALSATAVACSTDPSSRDVARVRLVETDALFQTVDPQFSALPMISAVGSTFSNTHSASTILRTWQLRQGPNADETLRFAGVIEANILKEGWILYRLNCDSMNAVYERIFFGAKAGSFIATGMLMVSPSEVRVSVDVPVGNLGNIGHITAAPPVSITTCG